MCPSNELIDTFKSLIALRKVSDFEGHPMVEFIVLVKDVQACLPGC